MAFGSSDESIGIKVSTTADTAGLKQTDAALSDVDKKAKEATISTTKLTGAVALGNAAYDTIKNTVRSAVSFMGDSVKAANEYQGALTGLSSISRAYGVSADEAKTAAKSLSSDGLMSVSDAATGLKNLLATGFSLDQATTLMNSFKDSAAFGKQSALSFGDAIRGATEGLKNGNSMLVDNAGVTKNLSVILQEAGKSQNDVMNITSDASVRQAVYNGILHETTAQTGDAARLSDTFAGAQARASQQTESLKRTVGAIEQAIGGTLVGAYSNFLAKNRESIISFGAAAIAGLGMAAGLITVVKAVQLLRVAMIALAANPLMIVLTAISVLAGVVMYNAMGKMQKSMAEANDAAKDTSATLGKTIPEGATKASKSMEKLADQLGKIDEQIVKANRDFGEQMAEMVKSHQDKVKDLGTQLGEETDNFKRDNADRLLNFQQTQDDMADSHGDKIAKIETQINQEVALGKMADKKKLDSLYEELGKENQEYQKNADEKKAKYDKEVEEAKTAHDKKMADMQAELDQENALLKKHADDVAGIRNVTLLDEIDKLKRSHTEQLKSFDDQKNAAIKSSSEATQGVSQNWNNLANDLKSGNVMPNAGKEMGTAMGKAFKEAIAEAIKGMPGAIANWFAEPFKKAASRPVGNVTNWLGDLTNDIKSMGMPHFSTGVRNFGGGMAVVGDINGQGGELIDLPQGSNVYSNSESKKMLGGGMGATIYQTNNIYSDVDLDTANRELGYRLANA